MQFFLTPIEQHVVTFVLKLRKDNNLTQGDIATVLNVDVSFVTKVENEKNRAKYNMNHVNLLADHFGISPRDFFPEKALLKKD